MGNIQDLGSGKREGFGNGDGKILGFGIGVGKCRDLGFFPGFSQIVSCFFWDFFSSFPRLLS